MYILYLIVVLHSMISSGEVCGTLKGQGEKSVFIPKVYISLQDKWVDSFFLSNGYLGEFQVSFYWYFPNIDVFFLFVFFWWGTSKHVCGIESVVWREHFTSTWKTEEFKIWPLSKVCMNTFIATSRVKCFLDGGFYSHEQTLVYY